MSELSPSAVGPKKARFHRSLSLQRKFLLGIGVTFLAFSFVIAAVLYTREKSLLEQTANEKTEMVLAAEEATRSYIQDVLRPKMFQVMGPDAFILEGMSTSYVSRAVMDRLKKSLPEYQIRRVALNARNPASEPMPFEVNLINNFAAQPRLASWQGIIKVAGQSSFLHARPVYFTQDCMHCHGNPADAPPALLKLYGPTRGFGHKSGDIAGMTAVSLPVDVALAKIRQRAAAIFGLSLLGLSLLYVGVFVFFNRVVIHSLRDLLEVFRHGLRDEKELELLTEAKSKDEIGELTTTAQIMVSHLHDARQQLEEYAENLVHSKDLLQSVFDGITDIMVLLDRDLRIKMVNQAYLRHYGVTLAEILDQSWGSPPADGCCPYSPESLERVFTSKTPMSEELQSSAGEIFRARYYPIIDDRGEVVSIVRNAKDITVEKRVELRIQHAERLASLGQLAGGLAHEINNPLGVILCYVDLLKSQLADFPQGFKDVAIVEKHAVNCQRIVADLLEFARGQETARQPTALNATIEEVVRMVDPQFRRQRCAIELDLAPDLPRVNIDANRMKQVYLNLLMNARQAISGRGTIRIQTSYLRDSGQVRLIFQDNGSGIPPGIIDRIFDPFFSTKKTGEGTGLGLSVSYGIIKEHGGDIQVESEPGQWTRFTIELPVEDRGGVS